MKANSSARKVQEVIPTMTIVEPTAKETSAKVINFKATAEETPSEPIDQVTPETVTKEQTSEATPETVTEEQKPETTPETEPETISIFDVIKKVNEEYNNGSRILPSEAARRASEELPTPTIEKPKASIEEIKRRNEVLTRLTVKYDALTEKRRRVEDLKSHDGDTASVRVRDAQGEVFESNSPKTIGKLVEFWKAEFTEALAQVENEIREIA